MALPGDLNKDDSIDALKKRLDRWGAPESSEHRSTFGAGVPRASVPSWMPPSADSANTSMSLVKKIFFAALFFFVIAVGAGILFTFSGTNVFSLENVEMSATGPVSVEGGMEVVVQIAIANKNNVRLETADFAIEYPLGTRDPLNPKKELRRSRELIGTIEPGEVVTQTARALLFGQEGSRQVVRFVLEYRTPDSNAIFVAEKEYEVTISSSPVALTLALPTGSLAGQEVALDVDLSTESQNPLKNILVTLQYPPGFIFKRAEPKPTKGTSVWNIEEVLAGKKVPIHVVGVLEGQDSEIKSFKATAGIAGEKDPDVISTVYTSEFKTITIERPQLGATLVIGGSEEPTVILVGGQDIRGEITFTNNLSERVEDAEVRVRFVGASLDKNSVTTDARGFYQSTVPDIVWDKDTTPELEMLDPGEQGKLGFGFAGISAFKSPSLKNREVTIEFSLSGTRLREGGAPSRTETKITRIVRFPGEVQMIARSLYSIGPFKNEGPLPPTAEKTTSYTVVWSLAGSGSDIEKGKVETTLPSYVKWLGNTSPSTEDITFNPSTGKVTWNVGTLRSGTGLSLSAKEAFFQVSITPSIAQVGLPLALTSGTVFSGRDTFSGTPVQVSVVAVSTETETDPSYVAEKGRVAK